MGLSRTAFKKGVMGGSTAWTWLGVAIWTVRFVRWLGRREEQVVYSERIPAGRSLQITAVRPLSRREQRRARRNNAR